MAGCNVAKDTSASLQELLLDPFLSGTTMRMALSPRRNDAEYPIIGSLWSGCWDISAVYKPDMRDAPSIIDGENQGLYPMIGTKIQGNASTPPPVKSI
ncbi:MAG: hypothetical protein ACYCTV_05270 [Leptospirales bacterium]